jgi:hypothetical protein
VRLDHLLSKECRRPFPIISERPADHYPVEHWLFGRSRTPADDRAASDRPTSVRRTEPAVHGPVPAGTPGPSLFRFEGATPLGVDPGDVVGLLHTERASTAHPVRALVGSQFPLRRSDAKRESRSRRALCRPLRIPKRARASLFSKLQRANGGCLGA